MNSAKVMAGNLRALMKERRINIKTLSGLSGVSEMSINRLRMGTTNPNLETVDSIASALDVPSTYLISRDSIKGLVHEIYPILSLEKRKIVDDFAQTILALGDKNG
jgi:transcriptional regulator with XRE-family HTH domain